MILITLVYLNDVGLATSSTVPVTNIREILCESPKVWVAYVQLPSMAGIAEFILDRDQLIAGVATEAQSRALGVFYASSLGSPVDVPLDAGGDVWSWLEGAKTVRAKLRAGRAGVAPGKLEDLLPRPAIS